MEQIVPEKERQEERQYCCRIGRVFAETLALAVPLHASIKKQVLLVTIVPNRGDPGFHSIEATLTPIRGDPSS